MHNWKVAAYLRLSIDDGDKMESNSITNQKSLINLYIEHEKDMKIKDYYIDDGYSGTDFERPDFKRLINDIEQGKINTIIVKDLSRFGRNYIEVGRYMEEILPIYKVRFIAVTDSIDSYKDPNSINNVIVPFKNLMNDEYARDVSNKVKSILNSKIENGEFIGNSAPFGYLKDPKDKHKFIVDEKASKIVKKIFKMALDGYSKKLIVDNLNKYGIPTPKLYKVQELNFKYKITKSLGIWDGTKVDDILNNRTYTGVLEQGKKRRISYKIHKNIDVSSEEWTVVPNHHKPLISKEDFEIVQDKIYSRDLRVQKNGEYDLFAGHIMCADCGNTLTKRKGKIHEYYYCTSYIKQKQCSKHTCQVKKLKEMVLETINKQIEMVFNIDKAIDYITKMNGINYDTEILNTRLESLKNKRNKYMKLKEELINDLNDKFINEDEYNSYKKDYENNLKNVAIEINNVEKELQVVKIDNDKNRNWINTFRDIENIDELNYRLVRDLIDCIYVHENGKITIKFKYQDEFEEAIKFIKDNRRIILAKPVNVYC